MILKCKGCSDTEWIYIDGVEQIFKNEYSTSELIKQYGEKHVDDTNPIKPGDADKVFYSIINNYNCPSRMNLNLDKVSNRYTTYSIFIGYDLSKEKECEILITNQSAYLLNNLGQTIERLV